LLAPGSPHVQIKPAVEVSAKRFPLLRGNLSLDVRAPKIALIVVGFARHLLPPSIWVWGAGRGVQSDYVVKLPYVDSDAD
jgi:hypothetical protein